MNGKSFNNLKNKGKKNDREYTRDLLHKKIRDLHVLLWSIRRPGGRAFKDYIEAAGTSFVKTIVDICEAALTLLCWDYASPEGTLPFPSMKDLANYKKDVGLDFPAIARISANSILDIKKEFEKSDYADPELIPYLAEIACRFLEGLFRMAKESRDDIVVARDKIREVQDRLECCYEKHSMNEYNRDCERDLPTGAMDFIVLDDKDYTEEELDELYRIRTKNKEKHIAPVYIMEIMMRYSHKENQLGPGEVLEHLKEKYGVRMERKAVSRTLKQLEEADFLCTEPDTRGKYWYDSEIIPDRRDDLYQ